MRNINLVYDRHKSGGTAWRMLVLMSAAALGVGVKGRPPLRGSPGLSIWIKRPDCGKIGGLSGQFGVSIALHIQRIDSRGSRRSGCLTSAMVTTAAVAVSRPASCGRRQHRIDCRCSHPALGTGVLAPSSLINALQASAIRLCRPWQVWTSVSWSLFSGLGRFSTAPASRDGRTGVGGGNTEGPFAGRVSTRRLL